MINANMRNVINYGLENKDSVLLTDITQSAYVESEETNDFFYSVINNRYILEVTLESGILNINGEPMQEYKDRYYLLTIQEMEGDRPYLRHYNKSIGSKYYDNIIIENGINYLEGLYILYKTNVNIIDIIKQAIEALTDTDL